MADIQFISHRGRFFVKGLTDAGRRWVKRVVSSDAESISLEYLNDYEVLLKMAGLSYDIIGRETR